MPNTPLDAILAEMDNQKKVLFVSITSAISDYWDWFQEQNRAVLQQRNAGLTDKLLAHVAPVLEKKVSKKKIITDNGVETKEYAPKYYLIWKAFNNNSYRRINKQASVYIPVGSPENIVSVISKKCTWELHQFLKTEEILAPLRYQLEVIHQAEIQIRKTQRVIERKYNQQKEV